MGDGGRYWEIDLVSIKVCARSSVRPTGVRFGSQWQILVIPCRQIVCSFETSGSTAAHMSLSYRTALPNTTYTILHCHDHILRDYFMIMIIINVNSSMELSDFHHKEVLILNRLPE